MNIIISNATDLPLYAQIKEQIKNKILTGEIEKGFLLPSIRTLAKDLRCSVITTKNAYVELEKEGYVETIPGKGTYIADKNLELAREEQLKKVENLIGQVIDIAKLANISREEIESLIEILYTEE